MGKKDEKPRLTPDAVHEYERLTSQLKAFYDEISLLSKKSPDGAMNKFKLKFINDVLKKATELLGEHRPFAEFEVFDEADVPTTSDVGVMLSQYLNGMDRFQKGHTYQSSMNYKWYWRLAGDKSMRVDGQED